MQSSNYPLSPLAVHLLRRVCLFLCCGLLACAALTTSRHDAFGQQPAGEQQRPRRVEPPAEQVEPDEVLRVDTDLIPVDVMATDAEGRPVGGVRAENFKLYEDGCERPLDFFNVEAKG